MEIRDFLKVMVEQDASDICLTVDSAPIYRIQGITPVCGKWATDQGGNGAGDTGGAPDI